MGIAVQNSLLASSNDAALGSGVDWVSGVLLGELAVGLSVIAIAIIGAMMLTGRMPFRAGGRVVLGVFVLLGAPVIAAGFGEVLTEPHNASAAVQIDYQAEVPRSNLPPADNDPYAGASLRRD